MQSKSMIQKLDKENINTKKYFEDYYSRPDWRKDWDGADKRLASALEFVETEYKKHLDVGCADGTFTKLYLDKFPETEGWGVDISEVIIEQAKVNCPLGHFQAANAYELPFKDNYFDLVHCAECIEHLEHPEKAIAEAYRVLKPGGAYIVTVPNETADDYVEHLWRWDAEGVRQLVETKMDKKLLHGFHVREAKPKFDNGHVMYVIATKE